MRSTACSATAIASSTVSAVNRTVSRASRDDDVDAARPRPRCSSAAASARRAARRRDVRRVAARPTATVTRNDGTIRALRERDTPDFVAMGRNLCHRIGDAGAPAGIGAGRGPAAGGDDAGAVEHGGRRGPRLRPRLDGVELTLLQERRAAGSQAEAEHLAESLGMVLSARSDGTADDEHDPEGPTLSYEWSRLQALRAETADDIGAVDAALDAGRRGDLRVCMRCGRTIGVDRLRARPPPSCASPAL